jgi:predicted acyl esterase
MTTRRRKSSTAQHRITTAIIGTSVLAASALVALPGTAGATAIGAVPTFKDGLSQNVFSATSSDWIRGQAWVESDVDGDGDGKPDRIHVEWTLPKETSTDGLKVPVILEESPYYAGLGPDNLMDWPVDHELGNPPTSKPWQLGWKATNTANKISTIYESTWLPRGFAVMHAESPGTGLSEGCPVAGGPLEVQAAKSVVDWLTGRAKAYTSVTSDVEVKADWSSGKVGMMGTSYNGTLPTAVATTGVPGLEAIVPISAISNWYEYYRTNGLIHGPGGYQGEDLEIHGEAVYSRADREICKPKLQHLIDTEDRVTGDYNATFDERNYLKNANKIHAAALIAHGMNDWNVMTKGAVQLYKALQANGTPTKLYLHQGGHGGAPNDTMLNLWFTRYLYGVQNGVENLPSAWIVRENASCPPRDAVVDGDQSNVSTLKVADSSKISLGSTVTVPQTNSNGTITNTTRAVTSIPDSTTLVLASAVATATGQKVAAGATITTPCSAANPTPYSNFPDVASVNARLNLTAGGNTAGGLTFTAPSTPQGIETVIDDPSLKQQTMANATSSPNRLKYVTPELTQPVRLSGTPYINVRMSISKPRANLQAFLIQIPKTGNPTIIDRGWADPLNRTSVSHEDPTVPGEFYDVRFDMQPEDHVFPTGTRIGLVIASSDFEYTIRPAKGTELNFDLSKSSLDLPIVGGVGALAAATGGAASAPLGNFQLITADVQPGSLSLDVSSSLVTMPTVTLNGFDQIVTGALNTATVADGRGSSAGWSLTGQVSDFVGSAGVIVADNLGWAPNASVVTGTLPVPAGTAAALVNAGPTASPGTGSGLGDARSLCSSPSGSSAGAFTCGGALNLGIPGSTRAGTYTGVLTLTLV